MIRTDQTRPGRAARIAATLVLWLGLTAAARACPSVTMSVGETDGRYTVRGSFSVPASVELAWAVLTDYDNIGDFVSSVKASAVVSRASDHLLLEQVGSGRVFIFSKRIHVRLRITEDPGRAIVFEDVEGRDFKSYEGRWDLERRDGLVIVSYSLEAELKSRKPGFLVRGAMQDSAHQLLEQVRAEIVRRAQVTADARPQP